VAEALVLAGARGAEVERVEREDHVLLAAVVAQLDLLAGLAVVEFTGGQLEVGGVDANRDGHGNLLGFEARDCSAGSRDRSTSSCLAGPPAGRPRTDGSAAACNRDHGASRARNALRGEAAL